jgi:hypothetical protein
MDGDDEFTPGPFDRDDPLSSRVANAIAWLEDVEPAALNPLQEVVDVDAMNRLFEADRRSQPTVSFEYEGYEIVIQRGRKITVRSEAEPDPGTLPPGTTALALAPFHSDHEEAVCNGLFSAAAPDDAGSDPGENPYARTNVLGVTFDLSDADPLDRWHFAASDPNRVGFLSVGGFSRGSRRRSDLTRSDSPPPAPEAVRIDAVSEPGDLQAIGMRINERLSAWSDSDTQSVLCFHSVSDLLDAAALEDVFRFLHLLNGWLSSKGTLAHFHLDPRRHDEQPVNTLRPLFDVVFEVERDGSWTLIFP